MNERVFIAMPSGRGAPDIDSVASLLSTIRNIRETGGVEPDVRFIHGNCYIAYVRNIFAYQFLKSDCSHLFFWDDDVAGPPGALRRLLSHDRDIIIAAYPKKVVAGTKAQDSWPIRLLNGEPDSFGLLESEMVATGFLLIKRHVIEAMYEKYADRTFWDRGSDSDMIDLFPTGLLPDFPKTPDNKNLWWGEDFSFSVLAKRAGFQIWLDPTIPLIHVGRHVWRGDFTKNAD